MVGTSSSSDAIVRMISAGAAAQPSPRESLSDFVVTHLRELLAPGALAAGAHLREMDIAAELQVSRGPVREAFAQLEREGLVELRRHRGAFVSELTRQDVEEVHTLRQAIEELAAGRAAERMQDTHLERLDRILEAMRETSGNVTAQDAVRLDLAFHDVIYDAADHQRLHRVWDSLRNQVSLFLYTRNLNFPDFPTVGHLEHDEFRRALASGDPAIARAAATAHMAGSLHRLSQLNLPDRRSGQTDATE
jgi:DNA-binding GntR family transcriptional regulator